MKIPRLIALVTSILPLVISAAAADTTADYIVITPPGFVSYWQDFIDYRKTTHPNMTFALVNTADIYNEYATSDDALSIHKFIEAMYAKGTRYVLLGAGPKKTNYAYDRETMIPTRQVITEQARCSYQYCDYYYCVVDKPSGAQEVWDYNGDGIYLASRNPNGGYYADATSQFSWTGKMMVHRFPARATVSLGGKTRTAEQQIKGYVNKLRRAEQGHFAGRFSHAVMAATLSDAYTITQGDSTYLGSQFNACTQEREFYDLGANIFSREHGKSISMNEYSTRERSPTYFTMKRPVGRNRGVLQLFYSNGDTPADFYARDYEALLINSHGSPDAVDPLTRAGVFNATGLCSFYIMCVPCQAANPGSGDNTQVSITEAAVVNPEGGSLVSFGNSEIGRWGGKNALSEKVEQLVVQSLYGCRSDGVFHNAGEARLHGQNGYAWSSMSPNSAGGMIVCDSMAYGDPLVRLSPVYSRKVNAAGEWMRGDQTVVSDQEYASTLTVTAAGGDMTINLTNDTVGAATLNVNGLNGKTLTIAGNGVFKTTNAINVDNGNLTLDVAGGFGRNGITFNNGAGKLKIQGEHKGYYGARFSNVAELVVAGGGATLDFDFISGTFRNGSGKIESLKFTGSGVNILRSRQAGIFSSDFTIPVTGGGTLVLETPNVGGSAAQNASIPLFAVTNATLAIDANPTWGSEYFSRSTHLVDGVISNAYETFGFGPSSGAGYDLYVGGNSTVTGTKGIRLNGALRLHKLADQATLDITGELINGTATGSVTMEEGMTVKLGAVNSFTGNITVPSGARLEVNGVRGLGSGNLIVQSGATLVLNAMPLAGIKQVTVESGAKLVLKSQGGEGSYQMYSPANTKFTVAEGVAVSDAENEGKTLNGIITPEGAYFVSDAAKYYRGYSLTWSATGGASAWMKGNAATSYSDGDTVLFKNTSNAAEEVPCSGDLTPGMMAFQNTTTAYRFTGADSTISIQSTATTGETSFEPTLVAKSQISVGGKTTVNNATTPALNVAAGGALKVDGTVRGVDTIQVIQFKITDIMGPHNATPYEHAAELSELQFYREGRIGLFPVGTTIKDNCGNTAEITGLNGSAYVFSKESSSIKNLFDGSTGTYHMIGSSITGPWTITITFPAESPYEMFNTFKYGRAQSRTPSNWIYALQGAYPDANPRSWVMCVGESESALKQVCAVTGRIDGTPNNLTEAFTANWTSSCKATVNDGAKLYLSGMYKVPLTIRPGAILAVTNKSVLTISSGRTLPGDAGSILIDTTEAAKSTSFFKVTSGLNLATDQVARFAALDDSIAFKIGDDHELYVATEGVMKAPYYATIDGDVSWGAAAWKDGDTNAFANAWSDSTQQPLADIAITVAGSNKTLNNDCAVSGTTLTLDSAADVGTFTLSGSGSLKVTSIDASGLQGNLVWGQSLNGANFTAPAGKTITIMSDTNGGKLVVPEGATVILQGTGLFTEYENNGYIRYEGTYGSKAMSNFATGRISIKSATLTGGLQSIYRTFNVREDDAIAFSGDLNSRINASFEMTGGTVNLNPNAASCWFGHEGSTAFRQTGGTFTCNATGTAFNGTANGLVLAYSSDGVEPLELQVYGGLFAVPNSSIAFYRPSSITIATNGIVRAKGVYSAAETGTIIVDDGGTFELGSLGVDPNSCTFNLFGGTLAGYENGAKLQSSINFSGSGTIAAKEGTTFNVLSAVNGSGELTIGATNYTGTVQFSVLPAEVDTFLVAGGTLNLGALRPLEKTLGPSAGAVAITLTNTQIKEAQTNAVRIIRATQVPQGGVKVYSIYGNEQSETVAAIDDDGYLTVRTMHDNTVETITGAKWGNAGDATVGGVATKADQAGFADKTWTINFSDLVNIPNHGIGTNGTLNITKIRLAGRKDGAKAPTGTITVSQADGPSETSTGRTTTSGAMGLYNSSKSSIYNYPENVFTFAGTESFDTTKPILVTVSGDVGYGMMQPANGTMYYTFASGNFSPIIEIVGDYSYKVEEPPKPIDAEQLILDFVMTSNDWMKIVYRTVDGATTNTILTSAEFKFDDGNVWRGGGNTISGGAHVHDFAIANGYWNGYPVPNSNLESGGTTNDRYWKIEIPIDLDNQCFAATSVLVKAFITNIGGLTTAQPKTNDKTYAIELGADEALICTASTCVLGDTTVNTVVTPCKAEIKSGYLTLKMYRTGSNNITGSFGGIQGLVFTSAKEPTPEGPTVTEGSGEVTDLGGGSYAVPTTVTKLTGIEPSKVVVKSGEHVITDVFAISDDGNGGVTIALSADPAATVVIGGETITLEPVLTAIEEGEHEIESPFVVGGESAAVGVKTIPGLTYKLVRGTAPRGEGAAGTMANETVVQSQKATSTRLKLVDAAKPQDRAFYMIRVDK